MPPRRHTRILTPAFHAHVRWTHTTVTSLLPSHCCRIPSDASILFVKPKWLHLILYKDKDLEIRGQPCYTKIGKRIYLCPSGAKAATGTAVVAACLGPLTRKEFNELRPRHKVPGASGYKRTFAWVLEQRQRVPRRPFDRKQGPVIWQTGPGGP